MEPPSKRRRIQQQNVLENSDDDDDELSYTPAEATAQKNPAARFQKRRERANHKLQSTLEGIFAKYGRDFEGVGDEVDMMTGEVLVDNGHLMRLHKKRDVLPDQYHDDSDESDIAFSQEEEEEEDDEEENSGHIEGRRRQKQGSKVLRGPKAWLLPGEELLLAHGHPPPSAFQRTAARAVSATAAAAAAASTSTSSSPYAANVRKVRMRAPWRSASGVSDRISDTGMDDFALQEKNQKRKSVPSKGTAHARRPLKRARAQPLDATQGNQETRERVKQDSLVSPATVGKQEAPNVAAREKEELGPEPRGRSRSGRLLKAVTGSNMVSWTKVLDEGLLGRKELRELEKDLGGDARRATKSEPVVPLSAERNVSRVKGHAQPLAHSKPSASKSRRGKSAVARPISQLSDDESSFQIWDSSVGRKDKQMKRKRGCSRQSLVVELTGISQPATQNAHERNPSTGTEMQEHCFQSDVKSDPLPASTVKPKIPRAGSTRVNSPKIPRGRSTRVNLPKIPRARARSTRVKSTKIPRARSKRTHSPNIPRARSTIHSPKKALADRVIPDSTQEEDPYDLPPDDDKASPYAPRARSVVPNSTSTPPSARLQSKRQTPFKSPLLTPPSRMHKPQTPRRRTKDLSQVPSSLRSLLSIVSDDDDEEVLTSISASKKRGSLTERLRDVNDATPSKNRAEHVVVITPGHTRRVCGADGFRCGRSFCFSCQRQEESRMK